MPPDDRGLPAAGGRSHILWFAVLVMLVTTLPYLLGYAVQGQDWRFTGFLFGVEDGNSYIAKMRSGAAGNWLFRTPYTTFRQHGVLAFLPYLLLGKLAQPPGMHVQLVALYHLFRIGAGILAILATSDFLALFLKDTHWRRFGLLLATLGGGLGWAAVFSGSPDWLGSLPLDFYSPESFGFLSLYGLPHLALARALLLWGFTGILAPQAPRGLPRWLPGACWLLLGLVQPLYTVIAWAVAGMYLLLLAAWQAWRQTRSLAVDWEAWKEIARRGLRAAILSSPPVLYTLAASMQDPFFKAWTAQNLILSPHPLHYLLAYGLVGVYILAGLPRLWKSVSQEEVPGQDARVLFLAAWALALPFLVYAPYPLQRRLAEGAWVALVALALLGLQGRPVRRAGLPLLFLFPSTLLLWTGGLAAAAIPALPLFRPAAETAAFEAIAGAMEPGAVVLAPYESANALPAWAPVRVIAGHGPESPGLAELKPRIERFYTAGTPDSERLALLREFDVKAVFWNCGPHISHGWDPHSASYLRPVYDKDGCGLFTVLENTFDDRENICWTRLNAEGREFLFSTFRVFPCSAASNSSCSQD
jgi:hypothetical protein